MRTLEHPVSETHDPAPANAAPIKKPNWFARLFCWRSSGTAIDEQGYPILSDEKIRQVKARFDAQSWDETADADKMAE